MLEDGETLKAGQQITSRLSYALEAPNGRRIPISRADLHFWFFAHYRQEVNKRHERVGLVLDEAQHGMWAGAVVDDIRLQRGAWRILQSDEAVIAIPQMQTQPLAALAFESCSGTVRAHYPAIKKTPEAVEFGDESSSWGSTETPTKE